jgi:coenzyme PQQ precursor peptide PqqA
MHFTGGHFMVWTKPEFTVVAVTMEVTAYAATKYFSWGGAHLESRSDVMCRFSCSEVRLEVGFPSGTAGAPAVSPRAAIPPLPSPALSHPPL